MNRRAKLWMVVASLFSFFNLVAAGLAAAQGEPLHAATHVALAILGAYVGLRIARRSRQQELPGARPLDPRLEHLQQSLDSIALEVERIGEAQRFNAKLAVKRAERSSDEGASKMQRPNEES